MPRPQKEPVYDIKLSRREGVFLRRWKINKNFLIRSNNFICCVTYLGDFADFILLIC